MLIALFAAIIAALGLLPKITLTSGIPITAQSMGIMLCGTILGSKRGGLAVLLFIFLVAIGLPLLSGGRGGLGVFTTPWAGFLFGFPVAAYVTGFVMEQWRTENIDLVAGCSALIGGIGAALTVSLRSGGVLVSLLVLPLTIPVLIFATGTVQASIDGLPVTGHFAIIGMMLMLALTLSPFATSAVASNVAIGTAAAPPASPPASATTAKPSFSGALPWKYMPDTMLSPSATMPPAKTQPAIVLLRSSIGYQP